MPQEKAFKRRAVSQLRFTCLCMPATSSMETFREDLSCEEHSLEDFTQRTTSLGAFTEYWWIEQYYIKYYQIFFDINFFGVKTAIISITGSLKRNLAAQSRGDCENINHSLWNHIHHIYWIFLSLAYFPSSTSSYEDKIFVQGFSFHSLHNFKLLWTFSNNKPPPGRSDKNN